MPHVDIGGRLCRLHFDWAALARLKAEVGDIAPHLHHGADPRMLARILAIGLARHHPDIDAAAIEAASPAILPAIAAVDRALRLAYWGSETGAPGPENEAGQENPRPSRETPSPWLSRLGSALGWRRPNSGG